MQACIEIAPEGFPVAIRKSASKTTTQEQQRFTQLISQLIANGRYGQLVAIHADMSHDQHGSMGAVGAERFLSWHRDFLLQMEREMQQIDAAAFIPYWNWAADRTVPSWLADFHPDVPVPGRRHPLQVRRSLGRRGRLAAQWEVDALVQNPDRRAINPNLWARSDTIGVFDHEQAFAFLYTTILGDPPRPWIVADQALGFRFLEQHVFYPALRGGVVDLDGFEERLGKLTKSRIAGYFKAVPKEWRSGHDLCEKIAAYLGGARKERTKLIAFLKHILR